MEKNQQLHRHTRNCNDYVVLEYKIVDQHESMFRKYDKEHFEGFGMCGPICLAVMQLLSDGLAQQPLEEICRQLRDESVVLPMIDRVYSPIKTFRTDYYRSHRFEFNKNPQEAHLFMRHTVDAVDINHVLQTMQTKLVAVQAVQQVKVNEKTEPRT